MDRFLNNNANKRSRSDEVSTLPPVSKKSRPSAKQGNVTAAVRVAEFGKKIFFADGGNWEAVLSFLQLGSRSSSEGHRLQTLEVEGNYLVHVIGIFIVD